MKTFFISKLIKLGLWIMFTQFLAVPLFAEQKDNELLITNFEKSYGDSSDLQKLGVLLPKSLEMISYTSKQPGITITLCDSVYLLRIEFRNKANEYIIVNCDILFVKRDSIVDTCYANIAITEKYLKQKSESLAEQLSDSLEKSCVAKISGHKKIICISDFEVTGSNLSDMGRIASRTMHLLGKKLRGTGKYIVKSGDEVYLLVGEYGENKYVYIKSKLISAKSGKPKFRYEEITIRFPEEIMADSLAEKLYSDIVFDLCWKVRIGIAEFSMLGGDTAYKFLKGAITANLKNSLKGITLVETYPDSIVNIILKTLQQRGKTDIRTELRFGKILLPKYLITGQFWELNGEIGISAQCVKIETGAAIFGKGINLQHIDIDAINVRIAELASDIQTSISRDIMSKNVRKIISVIGLRPLPNTEDNRERTKYILQAISKKLKSIGSEKINVRENREKIESFLSQPADIWTIIAEFNVDRLLVIQYEDYGEGEITIDANLYDRDDARTPIYSRMKSGSNVDAVVNVIIKDVLDTLRVAYDKKAQVFKKNRIRTIIKRYSGGLCFSRLFTDENRPLGYHENSSFSGYLSFPLSNRDLRLLFLNYRPKGVVMLTWDWGNNTLENLFMGTATSSVHLFSLFLAGKFNLHKPDGIFSPYIGGGLGLLWLRRILGEDFSFIHAPGEGALGATLIGGGEVKLGSHFHLVIPLKWYIELWPAEFKPKDSFKGGRLWGVNIGLGFHYDW